MGLTKMQMVDWLSFNIGEVLAGTFSIIHSIHLSRKIPLSISADHVDMSFVMSIGIGSGLKIISGIITTNPIAIFSGVYDLSSMSLALYFVNKASIYTDMNYFYQITVNALSGGVTGGIITKLLGPKLGENADLFHNRILRNSFAGTISGIGASCTSVLNSSATSITIGAVSGFILGDQIFDKVLNIIDGQLESFKSESCLISHYVMLLTH